MNNNVKLDTTLFEEKFIIRALTNDNFLLCEINAKEYKDGLIIKINKVINKFPKEILKKTCEFLLTKYEIIYIEENDDSDKKIALDLGFTYLKGNDKCIYMINNYRYNKKNLNKHKTINRISNRETNVCDNHWDGA